MVGRDIPPLTGCDTPTLCQDNIRPLAVCDTAPLVGNDTLALYWDASPLLMGSGTPRLLRGMIALHFGVWLWWDVTPLALMEP